MKKLQLIGLWMIFLVLTIPIIQAQSLTGTKIVGNDEVENFFKRGDTLTIETTASIPDDSDISPDQLRIRITNSQGFKIFSSCTQLGGSAKCTYEETIFATFSEPLNYKIQLISDLDKFRDAAIPLAEVSKTVISDNVGASIESLTVTPEVSKDGKFNINFLSRDAAFEGDTRHCSGVDEVQVLAGPTRILTQQGNKQCSFAANVEVTINEPDGEYELCLQAYDLLGQTNSQGSKCVSVIKDAEAPKPIRLDLFQQGERVTVIRPSSDNFVEVHIEISDPSLKKSSVIADLSEITTNSAFKNRPADTFIQNTAVWLNVPTGGMTNCLVRVSAEDASGNSITKEPIGCAIGLDNTGPLVIGMSTGIEKDGVAFFPESGTITAILRDDVSGLKKNDITMDLSQVNGLRNVKPDFCEEIGENELECTWFVTASKSGTASIVIEGSTTDRIGNLVQKPQPLSIIIDKTPPTIEDSQLKIYNADTGEERIENLAIRDDTVEITVVVRDAVNAEGNFSAIGVEEAIFAQCTTSGTLSECVFTATVESSGEAIEPVLIYFFDEVGNRAVHEEFVNVQGTLDDENPNHWRTERVICSPDIIDNSVTEFINFKVTCAAILKPLTKNARIINLDFDRAECSEGSGAVAELTLSNSATGTTTPLLNILLNTQRYTAPINFTCPLRITSQIGSRVTAFPEIEQVPVRIDFFNNPLGDAASHLDSKVLKSIKEADKMFGWVGDLKKIIDYLQKVCQVKQQINNLITVLNGIFLIVRGVGSVLKQIKVFGIDGVGEGLQKIADNVIKRIHSLLDDLFNSVLFQLIDSMCIFLNCGAASDEDDDATLSVLSSAGGGGPGGYCTKLQTYLNDLVPSIKGQKQTGGVTKGEDRDVVSVRLTETEQLLIKSDALGGRLEEAPASPNADRIKETQTEPKQTGPNTQQKKPRRKGYKLDLQSTQAINVKESLIWSVVCLCLPGIIHNLEKWHQLQCKYAVCLGNEVRGRGLPVSFCDDQKAYDECAFVFNQIFNAIPFSQVFSDFGAFLEAVLADPTLLISVVLGVVCDLASCPPENTADFIEAICTPCNLFLEASKIADAVMSLKQFAEALDTFFEVNDGYCGQMKDLEREIKRERAALAAPPAPPEEPDPENDIGIIELQNQIQQAQEGIPPSQEGSQSSQGEPIS